MQVSNDEQYIKKKILSLKVNQNLMLGGFTFGSFYFVSLIHMSILTPTAHCFITLRPLFKVILTILCPSHFHVSFKIILSISTKKKKVDGILIAIVVDGPIWRKLTTNNMEF